MSLISGSSALAVAMFEAAIPTGARQSSQKIAEAKTAVGVVGVVRVLIYIRIAAYVPIDEANPMAIVRAAPSRAV